MAAPEIQHIAVVPARKGSKGLPGKNPLLFGLLADFLDAHDLFDRIIVTSDDEALLETAHWRGYEARRRPDELARDDSCIRDAFIDVAKHCDVAEVDFLWLVFIPLVYRNAGDFRSARQIVEREEPQSLCSFIPARTHPFTCWQIDREDKGIRKFIDNDLFNRQQLPPAWENYNYLCCARANELERLDGNLLNADTRPILFSADHAENFVELDTPAQLTEWRLKHPEDYGRWRRGLTPEQLECHGIP